MSHRKASEKVPAEDGENPDLSVKFVQDYNTVSLAGGLI
jgi:hypothetical protein